MLYRSVREGAIADVGRAITMAATGAAVFAPVEYVLTLWAYAGESALASKVRLLALTATLSLVLFLLSALALSACMIAARLLRAQHDPVAARGPGWFSPSPLTGGIRPGVPRLWAAVVTALLLGAGVQRGPLAL